MDTGLDPSLQFFGGRFTYFKIPTSYLIFFYYTITETEKDFGKIYG